MNGRKGTRFIHSSATFHNRDLLLLQSIQLVDQRVYLPVGGLYLPLQGRLLVRRAGLGVLLLPGRASVPPGPSIAIALCPVLDLSTLFMP